MLSELRKVVTYDEEIRRDGDRPANPSLRMIGVAAVVRNPWAGRGFIADLSPETQRMAPVLGKLLTDRLIAHTWRAQAMQSKPTARPRSAERTVNWNMARH